MEPEPDPLARLDPRARAGVAPRLRVGVGAAIVLLVLALLVAVLITAMARPPTDDVIAPRQPPAASVSSSSPQPTRPATLFVHVLGAVRRSGLFELPRGARVMDAVAAAGGLTTEADPTGINLARPMSDGEQLYVPMAGEARPGAPPASSGGAGSTGTGTLSSGAPAAPVNLNTATVAELETLPRIGPAMAQRIVDYRQANGLFGSVDDLRNVTGIGEKTLEAFRDRVTV